MRDSCGDVDALSYAKCVLSTAYARQRCSVRHNPMFSPVVVQL